MDTSWTLHSPFIAYINFHVFLNLNANIKTCILEYVMPLNLNILHVFSRNFKHPKTDD